MLKKLISYELKKSSKIMIPACFISLIYSILCGVQILYSYAGYNDHSLNDFGDYFGETSFYVYLPMIFAATILLAVRYYKSLYASEGYFAFTLPASISNIISSKIIVGFIWEIATILSITVGLFSTIAFNKNVTLKDCCLNDFVSELLIAFVVWAIVYYSTLYLSVTIGRLWSKHIIIGTFLSLQVMLAVLFVGLIIVNSILYNVLTTTTITLIFYSICAIIAFFLINYINILITKKTLNLE